MEYPNGFQKLIDCFKRIPGVGSKSAERMAYDILNMDEQLVKDFSETLINATKLNHCSECGNLCDDDKCSICLSDTRDHRTVCVVHYPKDVFAFEKMKEYSGVYHVLNGVINPSKGKLYDNINLNSLINKVENKEVDEVILATNLTVEGEMTALYISKMLKDYDIKITRLAHGLPMGAQLDYADEMTLYKAFSNRKEI